jgi:HSP20 family molecular chaperone IbpA
MKLHVFPLAVLAAYLAPAAADGWSLGPSLLSSILQDDQSLTPFLRRPHHQSSSPHYELVDNDEKFELALDVPGVSMEDIEVRLEDGGKYLTISGHRQVSDENYSFSSRFSQNFGLDPAVEIENFTATLKNGILVVSAPKDKTKVASRFRRIPITVLLDDNVELISHKEEEAEEQDVREEGASDLLDDAAPVTKEDDAANEESKKKYNWIGEFR